MKYFDATDVPRFATPSIRELDPFLTAPKIAERLSGSGFMSYDPLWGKLQKVCSGQQSIEQITQSWSTKSLINAMHCLDGGYRSEGTWYPFKRVPRVVVGVTMKPAVRGILFRNGRAEAHLINARKGQVFSDNDYLFLARAAYEEHCRNDPNDPVPVVVDTSELKPRQGRIFREREFSENEMISLDEFENTMDLFFQAVQIAGYPINYSAGDFASDLFSQNNRI